MTHNRYRYNLELNQSKNDGELKMKLSQFNDHAFRSITQDISLDFDSLNGKVSINAPIAYRAGLGAYTVEVKAENPMTFKGTIKPDTIIATVEEQGLRFKYTADIQVDVTVRLHPSQKKPMPTPLKQRKADTIEEFTVKVFLTIVGTALLKYRLASCVSRTTSSIILYNIEMNHQGYRAQHPGML